MAGASRVNREFRPLQIENKFPPLPFKPVQHKGKFHESFKLQFALRSNVIITSRTWVKEQNL